MQAQCVAVLPLLQEPNKEKELSKLSKLNLHILHLHLCFAEVLHFHHETKNIQASYGR